AGGMGGMCLVSSRRRPIYRGVLLRTRDNFWMRRLTSSHLSRRRFLGTTGAAGAGAAGLALVGCGGDDDDGGDPTAAPTTGGNGGDASPTEGSSGNGGDGSPTQ